MTYPLQKHTIIIFFTHSEEFLDFLSDYEYKVDDKTILFETFNGRTLQEILLLLFQRISVPLPLQQGPGDAKAKGLVYN